MVARTIQLLGSHTLDDLHYVIFEAFHRWDEHLYEFQFGTGPHDPKVQRFCRRLGRGFEADASSPDPAWTALASLNLKPGAAFGYWFDFGDNWYHQVNVLATGGLGPYGTSFSYPRVVASKGRSPSQYPEEEW